MAHGNWAQLTTDQKLEALRKDIQTAFDQLNRIQQQLQAHSMGISEIARKMEEMQKRAPKR